MQTSLPGWCRQVCFHSLKGNGREKTQVTSLALGLVVFFGGHLIAALTPLRNGLKDRLGEMGYKGIFSLIALAGLALIVWGKATAEFVPLYEPPIWGAHVNWLFTLLGIVVLVAGYFRSYLRRWVRHPMSVGIAFWAVGHLFANGDMASVLLFGSFLAYALFDIIHASLRKPVKVFSASLMHDGLAIVVGLGLYAALFRLHGLFTGIPLV